MQRGACADYTTPPSTNTACLGPGASRSAVERAAVHASENTDSKTRVLADTNTCLAAVYTWPQGASTPGGFRGEFRLPKVRLPVRGVDCSTPGKLPKGALRSPRVENFSW